MKKVIFLMIMAGLVSISACSSNDANMKSAENDAEMAKKEADAAAEEARMKAKAAAEKEKAAAEEVRMKAEAAAAKEKAAAEEAMANAESEQKSAMAAADSASNSDNKVSVCKHGSQVRTITLVYNDEASENICQVDYEKSSGVQTLWTAITDKDYCMEKAEAFVQKQEGWGWTCSALQ